MKRFRVVIICYSVLVMFFVYRSNPAWLGLERDMDQILPHAPIAPAIAMGRSSRKNLSFTVEGRQFIVARSHDAGRIVWINASADRAYKPVIDLQGQLFVLARYRARTALGRDRFFVLHLDPKNGRVRWVSRWLHFDRGGEPSIQRTTDGFKVANGPKQVHRFTVQNGRVGIGEL